MAPKPVQILSHSMQPQQFTVKATWTQLLSPSRPGTFLPCVRSPSSVFDKQVFYTSSTAAVVSLSWPLGGDLQTTHQQKQANIYKYITTKGNEIQTEEEKGATKRRLVTKHNKEDLFHKRENKVCVIQRLADSHHPSTSSTSCVRACSSSEKRPVVTTRHIDTTSSCCQRSRKWNALMPRTGTTLTYRYATQIC